MISSLGVGSGLELGGLLDNLVAIERQSTESILNRRQARAEINLSSIGTLRASVSALSSAVTALKDFELGLTVTSSSEAVTATAGDEADESSYVIAVQQIATAQSLASDELNPFTDPDASLGAGTLTITVGTATANIELSPGQDSLRQVRDAINASELNIQAAVVQDGADYRLLLTSGETGTAGEMTLTVSGSVDTRLASANMNETTAAADASYSVNGLTLSSSSNTIEDVLPGLTVELHAPTDGTPAVLTVGQDADALAEKIGALATAYNKLVNDINQLGAAAPDGSSAGPLVGDASLRSLQRQIQGVFANSIDTGISGSAFTTMVSLGVQTNLSGESSLDVSRLEAALAEDRDGVEALVAAFATSFSDRLSAFEGSDGIFDFRSEQLNGELRRIRDERDTLELRLGALEERLRSKFSALDALVSQFNSTSTFLAQQLESLASITPDN